MLVFGINYKSCNSHSFMSTPENFKYIRMKTKYIRMKTKWMSKIKQFCFWIGLIKLVNIP